MTLALAGVQAYGNLWGHCDRDQTSVQTSVRVTLCLVSFLHLSVLSLSQIPYFHASVCVSLDPGPCVLPCVSLSVLVCTQSEGPGPPASGLLPSWGK